MIWLALIPLAYIPVLFAFIKEKPEDVAVKEDNQASNDFKASSIEGGFTLQQTLRSATTQQLETLPPTGLHWIRYLRIHSFNAQLRGLLALCFFPIGPLLAPHFARFGSVF